MSSKASKPPPLPWSTHGADRLASLHSATAPPTAGAKRKKSPFVDADEFLASNPSALDSDDEAPAPAPTPPPKRRKSLKAKFRR